MLITIDGPSASGKGTLAKKLAQLYALPHLDTGVLYRIVAFEMLDRGADLSDAKAAVSCARFIDIDDYEDADLRAPHMGEAASVVSAHPELREALLNFQKMFARKPEGAILDGRDCGTVIAPEAKYKFFVTATPESRAKRRLDEIAAYDKSIKYEDVLADIRKRDERDSSRSTAPLRMPDEAITVDTTFLDVDAMVKTAVGFLPSYKFRKV